MRDLSITLAAKEDPVNTDTKLDENHIYTTFRTICIHPNANFWRHLHIWV
jgi:hypothetical protein